MLVFQATLGPVTWIVLMQIVSSELMNIPVATHWILNLLISQFFPILADPKNLGQANSFLISAGITFVFFLINIFVIKETKGMAKEQAIEVYLKARCGKKYKRQDPILETPANKPLTE